MLRYRYFGRLVAMGLVSLFDDAESLGQFSHQLHTFSFLFLLESTLQPSFHYTQHLSVLWGRSLSVPLL